MWDSNGYHEALLFREREAHRKHFEKGLRKRQVAPVVQAGSSLGRSQGGFIASSSRPYLSDLNLRAVWPGVQAHLRAFSSQFPPSRPSLPNLRLARLTNLRGLMQFTPLRAAFATGGLMFLTGVAFAVVNAADAYLEHDADHWIGLIERNKMTAVMFADGRLAAAVAPQAGKTQDAFARYGYLASPNDIPETWLRAVTLLEDKYLLNGPGLRSICGLDLPATMFRFLKGGGGSGLTSQLIKNAINQPGAPVWKRMLIEKPREWGAGCKVYKTVGVQGIVRLFADFAPTLMGGGGTTRGITATTMVLFGVAPEQATDAQLTLEAALVQKNLRLVPAVRFKDGCPSIIAKFKANGAAGDRDFKAAFDQCWAFARTTYSLKTLFANEPERLQAALQEVMIWERTGIQPVGEFAPIAPKDTVNVTKRTKFLVGEVTARHIRKELSRLDVVPDRVTLGLDVDQPAFRAAVDSALDTIQRSLHMRSQLCLPLLANGPHRHCRGNPEPEIGQAAPTAQVLLAKADLKTGAMRRLYASNALLWAWRQSMGSLGKLVILLAAVQHKGMGPESMVCPRAAFDGARRLQRVHHTAPHGFTECGPAQLMTFKEATAKSDSLAFYDVARSLPAGSLERALEELGLTPNEDSKSLAFDLAFGTQGASAAEMLAMGQALFGISFELPVHSQGPTFLQPQTQGVDVALGTAKLYGGLRHALTQAQIQSLRELLQAPTGAGGTLAGFNKHLIAGKTGTVSAPVKPRAGARPYVGGKLILGFDGKHVVLSSFTAPSGHGLGRDDLQGSFFRKPIAALFVKSFAAPPVPSGEHQTAPSNPQKE
jgi:hypothetical protein